MTMLILFIIGVLCVCAFCVPWNSRVKPLKNAQTVLSKTIPVFCMAVFSAVITLRFFPNDPYALWASAGLFFGMLGDAFLVNHFVAGGIFFGLGHICYCFAFLTEGKLNIGTALLGLVLLLALLLLRKKIVQWTKGRSYLLGCGIAYAVVLVFMLSIGLSMSFLSPSARTWLGALGGLIFVASDAFLLLNSVTKASPFRWSCSLSVYYVAQLLIALSVAIPAFVK